jgi:chemotaxis protein MotB
VKPIGLPQLAPRSARASGDRWLFGYADVVTLLFACFAALYAAEVTPARSTEPRPELVSTPAVRPEVVQLEREVTALREREPGVAIEVIPGVTETTISFAEAGSFPPGQAVLTPAALRVMDRLAALLRGSAWSLRVEGHTDDRPIRNRTYASNWDLSTARATAVVQWLVEQGGLDPARLSAAGYAEYRPREPNLNEEARARNRRVDLILLVGRTAQGAGTDADYTVGGDRPSGGR